jgi:16S rRNA (cytidine1402-2'-O)-methyltransferase
VPIPGASAVLAALVASGVAGARWSFEGFLPRSGRDRRERLTRLAADERATVLFEAPGRMAATLADLAAACGAGRPAAVCRELTKLHEEVVRGGLGELARAAASGELVERGEFAIVVGEWAAGARAAAEAADAEASGVASSPAAADPLEVAQARVEALVTGGASRSDAVRTVAAETGIGRRQLYVVGPDA